MHTGTGSITGDIQSLNFSLKHRDFLSSQTNRCGRRGTGDVSLGVCHGSSGVERFRSILAFTSLNTLFGLVTGNNDLNSLFSSNGEGTVLCIGLSRSTGT